MRKQNPQKTRDKNATVRSNSRPGLFKRLSLPVSGFPSFARQASAPVSAEDATLEGDSESTEVQQGSQKSQRKNPTLAGALRKGRKLLHQTSGGFISAPPARVDPNEQERVPRLTRSATEGASLSSARSSLLRQQSAPVVPADAEDRRSDKVALSAFDFEGARFEEGENATLFEAKGRQWLVKRVSPLASDVHQQREGVRILERQKDYCVAMGWAAYLFGGEVGKDSEINRRNARFVMPYFGDLHAGEFFEDALKEGSYSPLVFYRAWRAIAKALHAVHQKNWVHRDVRLEHIVMQERQVKNKLPEYDVFIVGSQFSAARGTQGCIYSNYTTINACQAPELIEKDPEGKPGVGWRKESPDPRQDVFSLAQAIQESMDWGREFEAPETLKNWLHTVFTVEPSSRPNLDSLMKLLDSLIDNINQAQKEAEKEKTLFPRLVRSLSALASPSPSSVQDESTNYQPENPGQPINKYFAEEQQTSLRLSQIYAVCRDAAMALEKLHDRNCIHGDVCVENILVRDLSANRSGKGAAYHVELVRASDDKPSGRALDAARLADVRAFAECINTLAEDLRKSLHPLAFTGELDELLGRVLDSERELPTLDQFIKAFNNPVSADQEVADPRLFEIRAVFFKHGMQGFWQRVLKDSPQHLAALASNELAYQCILAAGAYLDDKKMLLNKNGLFSAWTPDWSRDGREDATTYLKALLEGADVNRETVCFLSGQKSTVFTRYPYRSTTQNKPGSRFESFKDQSGELLVDVQEKVSAKSMVYNPRSQALVAAVSFMSMAAGGLLIAATHGASAPFVTQFLLALSENMGTTAAIATLFAPATVSAGLTATGLATPSRFAP